MNINLNEELIIRADDIDDDKLLELYVESEEDTNIIKSLINKSPILLIGSRGSGKTMLLRVAEQIIENTFEHDRVLPIFITFKEAALIESKYFKQWMLSKILFQLKRKLVKLCNMQSGTEFISDFFDLKFSENNINNKIDQFNNLLQMSWRNKNINIIDEIAKIFNKDIDSIDILNEMDYFNALMEDICGTFKIKRIIFLFDEACHNFIPSQQRIFFTLFRDMRSQYVNCKAAVYPGIVSYGDTFQKFHDATEIKIERKISDDNYISYMRKIIQKQIEKSVYEGLTENGKLLDLLIYASAGNPRTLLKSLNTATKNLVAPLKSQTVVTVIKDFYRTDIWNEHTQLRDKYVGYKKLIDWGREFIENKVLEDTYLKNTVDTNNGNQTVYFAIDRDSPEVVKQSIKILEHSGIISIHKEGIRKVASGKSRLFDRYQINLGIVLASEKNPNPTTRVKEIVNNLSSDLCSNYTMNSPAFDGIKEFKPIGNNDEISYVLDQILSKSIDELDIYEFLKKSLKNAGFNTLGDILSNSEEDLQKAYLIGEIRSRTITNSAWNAALEYISG